MLEVVARGSQDPQLCFRGFATLLGQGNDPPPAKVLAGQRIGMLADVPWAALGNHHPAMFSGSGAHIDDMIGTENRVLIMLDHHDGVAKATQMLKARNQAVIVALM